RISELVKRPGVELAPLLQAVGVTVEPAEAEWAGIELHYAGYLAKEREVAARLARHEATPLPNDLPYTDLTNLSWEAREKLSRLRPATIGQASRVPGVSPADVQVLSFEVFR